MYLDVRGRKTYAATGGKDFDPSLPTVMFVHGSGLDHRSWALQTRWFAFNGYSVLAPGTFAREILDTMPDGVALLHLDGRIRRVNPAMAEMAGEAAVPSRTSTGLNRFALVPSPTAPVLFRPQQ